MMLAGYGILAVLQMLAQVTFSKLTVCDYGGEVGSYAANGTFQMNLDLLAASLPGDTASATPAGFANATVGTSPDQVYAMALCRGDLLNASSCSACVATAFSDAVQRCAGNRGVAVYEDNCTLRFSGQQFTDFLREDQWKVSEILWQSEQDKATVDEVPADWFSAAVTKILAAVIDHAVLSNSTTATKKMTKYFATGEEADMDPKIYELAQCLPIMTPAQCRGCLGLLLGIVETQYSGDRLQWVRLVSDWCSLMYSARPFFEGTAMLQVSAPPAPAVTATPKAGRAGKKRSVPGILAGVACSVVLVLILSVFLFVRHKAA